MEKHENKSEIARLRQRIEDETYAMNLALNGPAMVARHVFISHKYASIGEYQTQLATHVGPEKALEITATIYFEVMDGKKPTSSNQQNSDGEDS